MKTPRALGLPYDTWRTGQRAAIRTILHSKRRHVVVQAPTGSGKSLIDAAVSKLDPRSRTVSLTATNALLQQYGDTFDHLALVKGAGNYQCLAASDEHRRYFRLVRHPWSVMCDDGACRSGVKCSLREDGCLFYDRLRHALASRSPLTNYAFWLAMRRYGGGMGFADRVIFDEAHALPEQLMSAFRIEIFRHELKGTSKWPTTIAAWQLWGAMKAEQYSKSSDNEDHRARHLKTVERFRALATMDPETWAFDVGRDKIVFEPTVPRLLFPLAADAETRLVYLSATVTPAMLGLLSIPEDDIDSVELPSAFPLASRPVYLVKTARVDHKMADFETDYWLSRIDRIIGDRLDRKGVIHTVSYERQQFLLRMSRHRGIMLAPRGDELLDTVERFKMQRPPAVLLSPAIEQGFDFPYDACEYVVLAKVPFPDTRSNIMRARIAATEGYRDHLTMQRIVQSAGRGMRAADDQCETLIVDDHARWFLNRYAHLAPGWFNDAVVKVSRPPAPPPRLLSATSLTRGLLRLKGCAPYARS